MNRRMIHALAHAIVIAALVGIAGASGAANAQAAAAPAKNYKPGEYELYDAALKAIGSQNFAKAIADARG